MDTIREELEIYRTVASMTGAILYRYEIASDSMKFIFSRAEALRYGSTINNYVQMLYRQRDTGTGSEINVDDLIQGLKNPEKGYFECKARLSNFAGFAKWYDVIGKTTYDDNNEPQYIIGRISEVADAGYGVQTDNTDNEDYDKFTGLLGKAGIIRRLNEMCMSGNGAEAAFAEFKVEGIETYISGVSMTISIAVCFKRIFPYNAYVGCASQNEFYVIYNGDRINNELAIAFARLKSEIQGIIGTAAYAPELDCGVYIGSFPKGQEFDIMEKAHMSLLKAKYHHPGTLVVYSDEIEMEFDESKRKLEDVEFDHNLVESALSIMSGSGEIGEAISLIFTQIGEKYGIDRIAVHELDAKNKSVKVTYSWVSPKCPDVECRIHNVHLVGYDDLEKIYEQRKIIIVSDTKNLETHKFFAKIQATGLKSYVQCVFTGKHHSSGCISFECFGSRHNWNDTEIKTFKLISQLVSSFLLNIREYEEILLERDSNEGRDALTGLLKQEVFIKEAAKYIKCCKDEKLAVVYTGMKNLMSVNSRFGYAAGDNVLKEYTKVLKEDERFIMGCRVNADNVIILAKIFDRRGNRLSAALINRLNDVFADGCEQLCPGLDVSITAGMAIIDDVSEPVEHYIDKALSARGRAVNGGLDGVIAD